MNDSLDKLIGNDELLTYICLILAILNTFLMSIIINDIKHHFSIYIFSLFEALFLIFIIYFLLKKKDIYNKDYDIKYDWYFYLRISIITLVFFNFALYIYNISNFPPINPKKTGGVLGFLNPIKYFIGFKSNTKVSPIPPIAKEKTREELQYELNKLQIESKQLQESLKNTNENLKKNAKMNVIITKLIAKASSHKKDEAQQKSYSIKQNDIINNIAFLNSKLKEDTAKLNNNNNRCADIVENLRKLPAVAPAVVPAPVAAVPAVPVVAVPVSAPINDRISILLTNPLFKNTLSASDLTGFSDADIAFILNDNRLLPEDEELRKLEGELYVEEEAKDELKNLEKEEAKKEAKEKAKKEAKEKAKKEAKQIYKNIKKLVTKNNSETDELIKKAKDLAEEKATEKINEISEKIKKAKEAKDKAKEAKDKGETKEKRKKRINTERMAKNERYKDIMLEKILIKSLKDKLLKNIEEISKAIVLKNQDAPLE